MTTTHTSSIGRMIAEVCLGAIVLKKSVSAQ
jgi:hypothetical protein